MMKRGLITIAFIAIFTFGLFGFLDSSILAHETTTPHPHADSTNVDSKELTNLDRDMEQTTIGDERNNSVVQDSELSPAISKEDTDSEPVENPETGINLTLSPSFINLITQPGETISSKFSVRNNNNFAEKMHISLATFTIDKTTGRPKLAELSKDDEFSEWISFDQKEFELIPNAQTEIKFTITTPKDAALGYYYGIVIKRIKPDVGGKRETGITGGAAIPVVLEVESPNARKKLELVDFSSKKKVFEFLPAEFDVTVRNVGNIHVVPFGDIFIDSANKKGIGTIHINPQRFNFLPDSERTLTHSWADGFLVKEAVTERGAVKLDKNGNEVRKVKVHFDKAHLFRFGKYTAHLVLVYNNGKEDVSLEKNVQFWVFPWRLFAIGGALIIFTIIGIKTTLGKLARKRTR